MNSIVEKLDSISCYFTLRSRKPEDVAEVYDALSLVANEYFVLAELKKLDWTEVETLSQYLDYLLVRKITLLQAIEKYIQETDKREIFLKIFDQANAVFQKINKGSVVRFLNNSYKQLWNGDLLKYSISIASIELVSSLQGGINLEVFKFLCSAKTHLMLDYFESFRSTFEKNPCLFSKLFDNDRLNEIENSRLEELLRILEHYYKSASTEIVPIIDSAITNLIKDTRKMVSELDVHGIRFCLTGFVQYREVFEFLKRVKHPAANEFQQIYSHTKSVYNKVVEENSQSMTRTVDVGCFIEKISQNPSPTVRHLALTTLITKEKISSQLALSQYEEPFYLNLALSDRNTDSYFTLSRQSVLEEIAAKHTALFYYILEHKEHISTLIDNLEFLLEVITKKIEQDQAFEEDLGILRNMLQSVASLESADKVTQKSQLYGIAMFLCALIEKVLRTIYIFFIGHKEYMAEKYATLGHLLSDHQSVLKTMFEQDQLNSICYFLSTYGEKEIGYNIRNRLAHWSLQDSESLSPTLIALLLYLYTDVINTAYLYFARQNS